MSKMKILQKLFFKKIFEMVPSKARKLLLSQFLQEVEEKNGSEIKMITYVKKNIGQVLIEKSPERIDEWEEVKKYADLITLNYFYFRERYPCSFTGEKLAELSCYGLFITHVENPSYRYFIKIDEEKIDPITGKNYKRYWRDIEKRGYIGFYIDISKDVALANFIFNKLGTMGVVYTSHNLKTGQKLTNMKKAEKEIFITRERTYPIMRFPKNGKWETIRVFSQSIPVEEYPQMKIPTIRAILKNTVCIGVTSVKSSRLSFIDKLLELCHSELKKKYNF